MQIEKTIATVQPGKIFPAEKDIEQVFPSNHFLRGHLLGQKLPVAGVLFTGILHSAVSFLLTLMFGEFFLLQFNSGSSKGKLLKWLGIHINTLDQFFGLLLILLIIKLVTQYFEKYQALLQGEQFVKNIREELFISQVRSPEDVFARHGYGNYLLRYSNDLKAVQQYLTKAVLAGVRDTVFVLMGLACFFILNKSIGILVAGYLTAAAIGMIVLAHHQQTVIRESRNKRSNLLAYVTRSFQRFSSIKIKGQEEKVMGRFLEKSNELFTANIENARWESAVESIVPFLHIGMIAILLGLIARGVISVQVSDGLTCILLLLLLQGTIKRLFKVPSALKKGSISLDKIASLVNSRRT